MKLDILKEKIADSVVILSEDGGDETANIINTKGNGNIIVTYFPNYPEPYTVLFRTQRRFFTDEADMLGYVNGILTETVCAVEFHTNGKPDFSGEILSYRLLDLTADDLAAEFGYSVEYLIGKQCRIRSWKGSYDADLEVVVQ